MNPVFFCNGCLFPSVHNNNNNNNNNNTEQQQQQQQQHNNNNYKAGSCTSQRTGNQEDENNGYLFHLTIWGEKHAVILCSQLTSLRPKGFRQTFRQIYLWHHQLQKRMTKTVTFAAGKTWTVDRRNLKTVRANLLTKLHRTCFQVNVCRTFTFFLQQRSLFLSFVFVTDEARGKSGETSV